MIGNNDHLYQQRYNIVLMRCIIIIVLFCVVLVVDRSFEKNNNNKKTTYKYYIIDHHRNHVNNGRPTQQVNVPCGRWTRDAIVDSSPTLHSTQQVYHGEARPHEPGL